MARPFVGRPVPVGRPAAHSPRASTEIAQPSRPAGGTSTSGSSGRRDRPAAPAKRFPPTVVAWAVVGLLWLTGLVLFAVGLRPVDQAVTETASRRPPEPPIELGPPPRDAAPPAPVPDKLALGEARGLSADVLARLPADTRPVIEEDDTALACERFGTKVDFVRSQSAAFRQAARDRKLVMVLHLAGNFEDPGFT